MTNQYELNDFTESLERVKLPSKPTNVLRAFGRSTKGFSEWEGGFLLKLEDGSLALLTGWCDTSGWGCQDGAEVQIYSASDPVPETVKRETYQDGWPPISEWDENPEDLNKWIHDGMKNPC